jgi:hypothetical protein
MYFQKQTKKQTKYLLRRGFLKMRRSVALCGCSPESAHPQLGQNFLEDFAMVDKGGDISPTGLVHSQKLPVGIGSSSVLVVKGNEVFVDDGDFPYTPLDWARFCVKDVCPVVGVSY